MSDTNYPVSPHQFADVIAGLERIGGTSMGRGVAHLGSRGVKLPVVGRSLTINASTGLRRLIYSAPDNKGNIHEPEITSSVNPRPELGLPAKGVRYISPPSAFDDNDEQNYHQSYWEEGYPEGASSPDDVWDVAQRGYQNAPPFDHLAVELGLARDPRERLADLVKGHGRQSDYDVVKLLHQHDQPRHLRVVGSAEDDMGEQMFRVHRETGRVEPWEGNDAFRFD